MASFAKAGNRFVGFRGIVDLQTSGEELPDWWHFKNVGSCRQAALSVTADFLSGPFGCFDPWQDQAVAGVALYDVGAGGPNRARILIAGSDQFEASVAEGVEALAFMLVLSNEQTVGLGSCSGCSEGACIVLNGISLDQYDAPPTVELTSPLDRNYVTWQAGIPDCPAATPVLNRTWGAVKTMYR